MGSKYESQLTKAKAFTVTYAGRVFMHTGRKTYYRITGFSVMKSSSNELLDESIAVHYEDKKGRPHTRLYDDFFGHRKELGSIVKRFVEVNGVTW
jgi:hypothetical protein